MILYWIVTYKNICAYDFYYGAPAAEGTKLGFPNLDRSESSQAGFIQARLERAYNFKKLQVTILAEEMPEATWSQKKGF